MKTLPLGFHVMLRLRDDRVIAPTEIARRRLARVVLERARSNRLLAFRAADTHLHLEVADDRAAAAQLARRIELALGLRLRLGCRFAPAHLKPIESQAHLQRTFFYILGQDERHGLASDPYFEASNLPDLLGLRLLGAYTLAHVRELLPRVRADQLPLRLPSEAPKLVLEQLAGAAAAAACVDDLRSKGEEVRQARRAAMQLARELCPSHVARALGMGRATLDRLRKLPPELALVRAIDRQLRLRSGSGETAKAA